MFKVDANLLYFHQLSKFMENIHPISYIDEVVLAINQVPRITTKSKVSVGVNAPNLVNVFELQNFLIAYEDDVFT